MPHTSRITMYEPAVYEVWIQGQLDQSWITQMYVETISVIVDPDVAPVTVLTATFRDQAELRGLLDRIYNLNLPLISVRYITAR